MIAIYNFYSISNGVQSKLAFSDEFRHCNVITYDGRDYVLVEFDSTGIILRVLTVTSLSGLLRGLRSVKELTAIISVEIQDRKKSMWLPWWVRSCNELCRYATGINLGFTFNPVHFYSKLLKYNKTRNYEILTHWRRNDGTIRRR